MSWMRFFALSGVCPLHQLLTNSSADDKLESESHMIPNIPCPSSAELDSSEFIVFIVFVLELGKTR